MTTLTRPDVTVTNATERDPNAPPGSMDVVISRDGKAKSYRTIAGTTAEVMKDGIEKVIADPYSAEWIPKESK